MDEKRSLENAVIFPAKHYLVAKDVRKKAVRQKQRLRTRTAHDLEMIEEHTLFTAF